VGILQESPKEQFILHWAGVAKKKILANRFLQVPPTFSYKRLVIGTKLYLSAKMSNSSKTPEGLKDPECKKGHLGLRPPIPYVPPTDLLQVKDSTEMLKVKLPNGTVFSMSIFAKGSPEEYLQHVIAILRLVNRKGLDKQCKDLNKVMKMAAAALGAAKEKSIGPQDLSFKKDQEAYKNEVEAPRIEKAQTQEMLKTTTKDYNKAVASTYELLHNLLASEPQTQWDCIIVEMHGHDSWAGLNGEKHKGKCPRSYSAFLECLSYLSSLSFLLMWQKDRDTTSNKVSESPNGLLCINLCLTWMF
jgi:hypothetical protein